MRRILRSSTSTTTFDFCITILALILVVFVLLSHMLGYLRGSSSNDVLNTKKRMRERDILLLKHRLGESERVYQDYVSKRNTLVGHNLHKINPWPQNRSAKDTYSLSPPWEYFLPTFSCPYSLSRIGNLGEGGKWVCGFNELYDKKNKNNFRSESGPECVVYSFGISRDTSYEAEILQRTDDCRIYAYDGQAKGMGPQIWHIMKSESYAYFEKIFISTKESEEGYIRNMTLGNLTRMNGHGYIDLLKMDIEGDEFPVLNQILDEFQEKALPFSQLQLRVYLDKEGGRFPEMYKLWERMEAKGLRAFRFEIDLALPIVFKTLPRQAEYSFLNTKARNSRLIPYP